MVYHSTHYDKVFTKTNAKGQLGLLYVKVFPDNVVYFVEAVTDSYGGEKLLINKQMIKTGIDSIPNVHGYLDAITKKQTESEFLSDLQEVRQAYVRNVSQIQSVENSIEQTSAESQGEEYKNSLREVEPVKSSDTSAWKPGFTTAEAMEVFPNLWNVAADTSETKNPTSVKVTESSYRKIYELLKAEGFSGSILDASSGLGYGTELNDTPEMVYHSTISSIP